MTPAPEPPPTTALALPEPKKEEVKKTAVQTQSEMVEHYYRFAQFRNRPMVMVDDDYPHFVPLTKERFDRMFYALVKGQTRSRVGDVYAQVCHSAPDLSTNDHLILFGLEDSANAMYAESGFYSARATSMVWDTSTLEWTTVEDNPALATATVWRSPYGVVQRDEPVPFVMSLAGGDQGLYDDIMQSLAPLVMQRKPDGVMWWVGEGANGKSTLMDALYRIFPGQLASITVKRLVDGRDTPGLNGVLANIVKESSEGRVDDTEIYKSLGTHESFPVHKFHSQESVTIQGNLHHIFSANNIPTFNDKGFSARRRTFIIPFTQKFQSDPTFEERTFTADMFGHLVYQMTVYAKRLQRQQYRYKWSAITTGAKLEYDNDANNAEVFARELVQGGVVAFESFNQVKLDYENWCADEGFVPLGITNMRRAVLNAGFSRQSVRASDAASVKKIYMLPTAKSTELQKISLARPGLYTMPGFVPDEGKVPVPRFKQPVDDAPPQEPEIIENKEPSVVRGW